MTPGGGGRMTPEQLAARCERIEGEVFGPLIPDRVFAEADGNTVSVWVQPYFGRVCQKFRITVESLGEVEGVFR